MKGVMAVLRELAAVGRLPRCRPAPSPFLELLPFSVGSFYIGLRRHPVSEGSSDRQRDSRPIPGSPSAKAGKEAGGWRDGGGLGQFSGWRQLYAASVVFGRWRGAGAVWWRPRADLLVRWFLS
ncbi:hypothetical protein OsI_36145 [Oryza sativa Indica Group]|uniref:Uncharacterized protein n=1 Tax=Oryza sativa subsp. indica TaxID=39946 RepID=B8BKK2_ORYSI|nr:hypothetical protein OsI_36145 [Oryza sativa Indica Group]